MGYVELPLIWVKSPELQQILLLLQDGLNKLDEHNFPNGVSGSVLKDASTPVKKLSWLEWPIPLVLAPQSASTTGTLDCGGFWVYDPAKYPGGSWYFECALRSSAAGSSVSAQLKNGATVLSTVSTTNANYTVVRSAGAVPMPSSQAVLTVTLVSSSSSVTAYLWTARMIFVP